MTPFSLSLTLSHSLSSSSHANFTSNATPRRNLTTHRKWNWRIFLIQTRRSCCATLLIARVSSAQATTHSLFYSLQIQSACFFLSLFIWYQLVVRIRRNHQRNCSYQKFNRKFSQMFFCLCHVAKWRGIHLRSYSRNVSVLMLENENNAHPSHFIEIVHCTNTHIYSSATKYLTCVVLYMRYIRTVITVTKSCHLLSLLFSNFSSIVDQHELCIVK